MIEKKVRALVDFKLRTYFGTHYLSEGEVKRIRFKNQSTFQGQVDFGNLVEAEDEEPEARKIPILLPDVVTDPVADGDKKDDEVSLEGKELEDKKTPADLELSNLPLQEFSTEPPEEIIPEVEEIPIEEEDENKSEPKYGEVINE